MIGECLYCDSPWVVVYSNESENASRKSAHAHAHEPTKPTKPILSQNHGILIPPGKILSSFFSYSGLSLNIHVKSQMEKGQTGRKSKEGNI